MENISNIVTGLRIPAQIPLDVKTYCESESVLTSLGQYNNLAYTYYEGLVVRCQLEKTRWEWREANPGERGLLPENFIYPDFWVVYGFDYSLKEFNFFKVNYSLLDKGFSKIVYFDSEDPSTASIFDIVNPPVTNDDLLKADDNNLYIGTDASSWIYHSVDDTYVTYVPTSNTSNFFITGTLLDAGGEKTGSITKKGELVIDSEVDDISGLTLPRVSSVFGSNKKTLVTDHLGRVISASFLEDKEYEELIPIGGNGKYFDGNKQWVDFPLTLPPSAHTHSITDITDLESSLNLKEDKANKGVANGYAPLDANNKVPLIHINDALLGNTSFQGLWNQNTNTPNLNTVGPKGHYYICNGLIEATVFGKEFNTGDWIISTGTTWEKVDNTDAVTSVNGMTGNVLITIPVVDQTLIQGSTNAVAGGAVYDTFLLAANQLELKSENSASALSGFEITNNGNGTLNINGGVALLRDQNDPYAILQKYTIPAVTNLAMVDNANNFVLVDYNSGTPAIIVTQNPDTINGRTNSIIAGVSRVGTTLDYISLVGQGVDSWQKIRSRFLDTETVTRAKGLELGASGLAISCTAGIAYAGMNKLPVSLLNTHTQAHRTGSTWVRTTGLTNLNNTQYNNAGTLTTLTNGRFRVDYVYVLVDNPSKLYTIMGEVQYNTIADARLATAPATLPTELQFLGMRVGRLIVEKSATTVEVSSDFNTVYRAGSVQNHNDLALLNTGNYNHFRATTSADAGKVLSVNSLGVADFATIPKAQFQSGELVDHLTIATAALEERFQLNLQPLVSNKHTFTLASGVVFPVTVHIETKAGSPSGYDGTAVITASNNSFANGISPSFSNSYKVYMPNATTLVYEWVTGQEIYDGYWGDKLSLRVPENGVAKALTSKAYVDAGLALKFPTPTGLTTNYLPKWNGTGFADSPVSVDGIALRTQGIYVKDGSNEISTYITYTGTDVGVFVQYAGGVEKNLISAQGKSYFNGGNTIFGTTDDNLVDKVQVNGSGSFSGELKTGTNLILYGKINSPDNGIINGQKAFEIEGMSGTGAGPFASKLDLRVYTNLGESVYVYKNVLSLNPDLSATFAGTITASPATASNHVVIKSQLDAAIGGSGPGTPTGLTTNYLPKWNGTGFGNSLVREISRNLIFGDFVYNDNFAGISVEGDAVERVKFGFKQTSHDVGLVASQVIATVSGLHLVSRDIAAGYISFNTGAGVTEKVRILGNGNTLFGTTDDIGSKVQVNGAVHSLTGGFIVNRTISGDSGTPIYETLIRYEPNTGLSSYISGGNEFSSTTGSYLRFTVNSLSGVNTPINVLTLKPTGQAVFSGGISVAGVQTSDKTAISWAGGTNELDSMLFGSGTEKWVSIWTNQNERVRITENGSVGIGTTSPRAKFQVSNGDIIIDNAGIGVLRGNNTDYGSGGAIKFSSSNTASQQYIQLGRAITGTGAFDNPILTVKIDTSIVDIGAPLSSVTKLNVEGSIMSIDSKNQYLRFGMEGDVAVIATDWYSGYGGSSRPMEFRTGGTTRLTIDQVGNITANSPIAASPATASNHLITLAQRDAFNVNVATDANTLYKPSMYSGFSVANAPSSSDIGIINLPTWLGNTDTQNYNTQIASTIGSELIYVRKASTVTGNTPWREVVLKNEDGTIAASPATASNHVVVKSQLDGLTTGLTTNYLPKWNGTGFVNSNFVEESLSRTRIFTNSDNGSIILHASQSLVDGKPRIEICGTSNAQHPDSVQIRANTINFTGRDATNILATMYSNGCTVFGTSNSDGVTRIQVDGNISASAAVNSNHVVIKSQLDAVGTSGTYTPITSNPVNISALTGFKAMYMKIGNIVSVRFYGQATFVTTNAVVSFEMTLPFNKTTTTSVFHIGVSDSESNGQRSSARIDYITSNTSIRVIINSVNMNTVGIVSGSFMYNILD